MTLISTVTTSDTRVPKPRYPLEPQMGTKSPQNHSATTVNRKAGTSGLWKLGRRAAKLALSWKYLEDLNEEKIRVNEVEAQAWTRAANREVKKGKKRPLAKGRYCEVFKRDKKYIGIQMKARAQQAREDWFEAKQEYNQLRGRMFRNAKNELELNAIKREVKRIKKENEKLFCRGREQHRDRICHLKEDMRSRQHMNADTTKRQELEDLRDMWFHNMVNKEDPPQPPTKVPVYGEAGLDSDEIACCNLPPKFNNYPVLNPETMKFESILAHTKTRWSRVTTGGPKDQEADSAEFGETPEPPEDQVIEEHKDRMW